MATFDQLYDHILPFLPGAEPSIVDYHIRRVLRDFFKRTTVWRASFTFPTAAGTGAYAFLPAAGSQVSSVLSVLIDGDKLPPAPEDVRDPVHVNDQAKPIGWFMLLPNVINFYTLPDKVYSIQARVVLTLPLDSTVRTFIDDAYNEYAEAIAAGVISAMMLMPGKPWTKVDAAAMYGRIYGSTVREARGKLRDGGQPNVSTFTAGRRFGV